MTLDLTHADAEYERATAAYHANRHHESEAELACLRLIAAHALECVPTATHMVMESSDQGNYMTAPSFLLIGEEHVAEHEWDERVEDFPEIGDAASWLTWGHDAWESYTDLDHPSTRTKSGYYAMDLRRIAADATGDEPALIADITAQVLDGDNDGKYAKVEIGPNLNIPERTVTVYVSPDTGNLIVEVDGPFEQHASDQLGLRVVVNDGNVFDSSEGVL